MQSTRHAVLHFFLLLQLCRGRILPVDKIRELRNRLRGDQDLLIRETEVSAEEDCFVDDFLDTVYGSVSTEARRLAADALASCLVENPSNRDKFAEHRRSHTIIADYARENVGGAAQVVAYAVYNHPFNFEKFSSDGVLIDQLIVTSMATHRPASDVMWCMAALGNLVSSYCQDDEGPCHWEWTYAEHASGLQGAQLLPGDVVIDGEANRKTILAVSGLVPRLKEAACHIMAKDGPFPSVATSTSEDMGIIPWAMAKLVSNLATSPNSQDKLEELIPCMCYQSRSFDHLESYNAHNTLHHLGREFACHWDEQPHNADQGEVEETNSTGDGEEEEEFDMSSGEWEYLCVDRSWMSTKGKMCHEIFQADCDGGEDNGLILQPAIDKAGVTASEACCVCGGGDRHRDSFTIETEHDEL